jgi:hypothetical protein
MAIMRAGIVFGGIVLVTCAITHGVLTTPIGMQFLAYAGMRDEVVSYLVRTVPCEDSYECWSAYYARVIEEYGSRVALFDLKHRYSEDGTPHLFCHTFLHTIGEAAGREYASVAAAYTQGDPFCRSGYYHGVLEGVFGEEGGDQLLTNLDGLCAEIDGKDRYSYDYFACVHGIGHGLMAYFDHEMFASLEACDLLNGAWEQSSCHGGVFMENIMSDTTENPSRFLSRDDPLYPCTAVGDQYRAQCYLMQTSHMLTIFDGDFKKVFSVCAGVEEKYRTSCYQSVGRDASGRSGGSTVEAFRMCWEGSASEARRECLIGAAVDFIQSIGPDGARELCGAADADTARACIAALERHIQSL